MILSYFLDLFLVKLERYTVMCYILIIYFCCIFLRLMQHCFVQLSRCYNFKHADFYEIFFKWQERFSSHFVFYLYSCITFTIFWTSS